jgi:hypothetical protein
MKEPRSRIDEPEYRASLGEISLRPPTKDFTLLGEHEIGAEIEDGMLFWHFPTDAIWVVYALYRSHMDERELAYPSAKELAEESGLSIRAIRHARAFLEKDLLDAVQPDETRRGVHHYYPDVDCRIRAGEKILVAIPFVGEPIVTRTQLYFVASLVNKGHLCPVPNWFLRDPSIPPPHKRLGAMIAGLAQRRPSFASYSWFAERLDVDKRTIARRVSSLRRAGKLIHHGYSRSGSSLLSIPAERPTV